MNNELISNISGLTSIIGYKPEINDKEYNELKSALKNISTDTNEYILLSTIVKLVDMYFDKRSEVEELIKSESNLKNKITYLEDNIDKLEAEVDDSLNYDVGALEDSIYDLESEIDDLNDEVKELKNKLSKYE